MSGTQRYSGAPQCGRVRIEAGLYTHHRPRTRPELVGVNVGCAADVDPYALEVQVLDGWSLP